MNVEEYRHQCEVRQLIRWRAETGSWLKVETYLKKPAVQPRAERLKKDIKEQITRGNKGNWGEWIETKD